jgi:hypothetical protein
LAEAVGLASRLHHPPPFGNVVADWLFDVDIFARLHGPNGGECMPVIGRRDGHRIDRLVIENLPQVLHYFRTLAALFLHGVGQLFGQLQVWITNVGDIYADLATKLRRVHFPANATTDDGMLNFIIGG